LISEISSKDFEQKVLKSKLPVLVEFYADWCGSCQNVQSITEELIKEIGDKIRIFKINVDKETSLASQYQVLSLPTILIFFQGQIKDQITTELISKEKLIQKINKVL